MRDRLSIKLGGWDGLVEMITFEQILEGDEGLDHADIGVKHIPCRRQHVQRP